MSRVSSDDARSMINSSDLQRVLFEGGFATRDLFVYMSSTSPYYPDDDVRRHVSRPYAWCLVVGRFMLSFAQQVSDEKSSMAWVWILFVGCLLVPLRSWCSTLALVTVSLAKKLYDSPLVSFIRLFFIDPIWLRSCRSVSLVLKESPCRDFLIRWVIWPLERLSVRVGGCLRSLPRTVLGRANHKERIIREATLGLTVVFSFVASGCADKLKPPIAASSCCVCFWF
ncbi:hypothetical protein Bca101_027503 [Brassica carinata]